MPHLPAPYIQNHVNWCWATAAKIAGLYYCSTERRPPLWQEGPACLRSDPTRLRADYVGHDGEQFTVDMWQQAIVQHASDPVKNPDGNLPETDAAKIRALRYVVTGDIHSSAIEVVSIGQSQSETDLLTAAGAEIREASAHGRCIIGNFIKISGLSHSVVLIPKSDKLFLLYDPWDGYSDLVTDRQVFQTGFLTSQGPGRVAWLQYIR